MTRLTVTVQAALAAAPGSLRALARAAGVSGTLLVLIARGQRAATPAVAAKVAAVLEAWGAGCAHSARAIRRAIPHRRSR